MTVRPSMHKCEFLGWAALLIIAMAGTFVGTADRVNWLLDAGWVVGGVPLVIAIHRWRPLTPLAIRLASLHALVLIAGGYWTYEAMPIGKWFQEALSASRNHYDRFGHFMQGFAPAILLRELFVKASPVRGGGWLFYFALSSALAFSAVFELLEWQATLLSGGTADAFLGHQGDIWDAQWDMLWAGIGALTSLCLLSRRHDRELEPQVSAC